MRNVELFQSNMVSCRHRIHFDMQKKQPATNNISICGWGAKSGWKMQYFSSLFGESNTQTPTSCCCWVDSCTAVNSMCWFVICNLFRVTKPLQSWHARARAHLQSHTCRVSEVCKQFSVLRLCNKLVWKCVLLGLHFRGLFNTLDESQQTWWNIRSADAASAQRSYV